MNYLFLDPGSSGTKILTNAEFCCGYFLESGVKEVRSLTEEEWEEERWAQYSFGAGVVELNGKTYRVGYRPATCLSAGLKYTGAIVKAIAALGSMDLGRGEEYLLGVVLPLDEYASRKAFASGVREGLKTAKFNGKPIRATLNSIRVYPEGAGLIQQQEGIHVALMVGHTDISLVRFEAGRIDMTQSQTFSRVGVGAIAASLGIPGSDAHIAIAVSQGRFDELANCGIPESDLREAEGKRKTEFFAEQIQPLLEAYSWEGVESVVLGGGGAKYLKDVLVESIPVKVKTAKLPPGFKLFGSLDRSRYGDIYGLAYRQIKSVIDQKLSSETVQSVDCEVA